MQNHFLLTLLLAIIGALILLSLGVWQLQRHTWKQNVIAQIDAQIAAEPAALPDAPDPDRHAYRPVRIDGVIGDTDIRVQASMKLVGAGYRIIAPFETAAGRRILIDRGFVRQELAPATQRPGGPATIIGNLHWPDEVDMFTPGPDREGGLWFARNVPALAEELGTEPVLVVVRETTRPVDGLTPLPLDTGAIPDNHLGYAVQWFLMGAVWVAMAAVFLRGQWRKARRGEA